MAGHQKWRDIKRKRDGMISKPLQWARARGLNCEQDIMAEQLRMQCQAQLCRHLTNVWLFMIFVVLVVK